LEAARLPPWLRCAIVAISFDAARRCARRTGKDCSISSIRRLALAGLILLQRAAAAAPAGLAANVRAVTGSAIDDPNGVAGEGT